VLSLAPLLGSNGVLRVTAGPDADKDARREREKRLAEALRANLKRRKARQRDRSGRNLEPDRNEDERR
jgi:hypothetical protein